MPHKLPLPHKRRFFSSFQIAPAVRVIARQLNGKNCLAAIFALRHQDLGREKETLTHTLSVILRKRPVVQRADFVLTKDPRPFYYKTPPCLFCHKIALRKAKGRKSALSKTTVLLPRGPSETSVCRGVKIAAGQFLPLSCRSITLTTRVF